MLTPSAIAALGVAGTGVAVAWLYGKDGAKKSKVNAKDPQTLKTYDVSYTYVKDASWARDRSTVASPSNPWYVSFAPVSHRNHS